MNQSGDTTAQLQRVQLPALIVGIIGLVAWGAGFATGGTREQFFQSYLYAYLFWLGLPLGSFALLMLHHTIGSQWGFVTRRILESSALTIPLMIVLFLPIALFGMQDLYEWAIPDVVAHDVILQRKAPYLNVSFFYIRALVYFLFWTVSIFFLNKWSTEQDTSGNPAITRRFRMLSAPGILFFVITMTFAAFDWGMSLEPHWFSSIYGGIFIIGQGLVSFAMVILIVALLSETKPLKDALTTKHFHDLGNLMFAFTILWTYFSLSQFLIIWSANLPEETPWYIHRQQPGWNGVAVAIVLFQFVLPFFLLLNRFMKRNISYLWKVAVVVIVMRMVDLFWYILPAFNENISTVHWMTFAAPVAFGGFWVWIFIEVLKRRPILPMGDPQLKEVLKHHV